jgi:hypothetical protein
MLGEKEMRLIKKFNSLKQKIKVANKGDLLFLIESIFFRNINILLRRHPSSYPFLSGDTYKSFSTKCYKGGEGITISKGDIVFCSTYMLKDFKKYILPEICQNFILITHHSDMSIDKFHLDILENSFLFKWYAQNNTIYHPKLITIPIGLEDAWRHNNGVIASFKKYINLNCNFVKKKPRILYGFNVATNPKERNYALNILERCEMADKFAGLSRSYRDTLSQFMFVASPEGNGIDCHRTWEAMYLGVVPIVLQNSFYETFDNFPGLIIHDWRYLQQLGELRLIELYKEHILKINNCEYIWADYWKKRITADVEAIKSSCHKGVLSL